MLQKEDNDLVKKCMEYEVEGARPKGRSKKTWREIVEKDCKARGLNREDAMYRSSWRKQIGMIDDHDDCEWANVFLWYRLTRVVQDKIQSCKTAVCVCVLAKKYSANRPTFGIKIHNNSLPGKGEI